MRKFSVNIYGGDIIYTFVEIAGVFFESFLVFFFFYNLFNTRVSWKTLLIAYLAFSGLFCVLSLLPIPPVLRLISLFICSLTVATFLFDAKAISSLFSVLLLCAITIVVDLVCMSIMNLLGWDNGVLMKAGAGRAVYVVFAKLIYLVIMSTGTLKIFATFKIVSIHLPLAAAI